MPFISKDWRSPGDYWVRSGSGWERFKVLRFIGGSTESSAGQEAEQQQNQQQPHCRINLRQTREISSCNTLSEALQLLDFQNALRDQRKFQYICVIIRLLISNPLLGGNSQRILVKLLFQICDQVRIGWRYDLLRIILHEMRISLDNCWGGNLGSAQLWNENKSQIDKIEELMATYREEAPKIPLQEFPEDIIRLIILKLNNDKDLRNLGESDNTLKRLVNENRIWRQLCIYHFSRENIINTAMRLQEQESNPTILRTRQSSGSSINSNKENEDELNAHLNANSTTQEQDGKESIDWENVYKYLKRNFNLKEDYAEVLNYCKPCNVLFWPSFGHPCIVGDTVFLDKDDKENTNFFMDVRPCDFVSFFST